jgi:cold shock CspA family protein
MTREQEETAKDAAPREQGVVRSLKDKFGFVSSVDAERDDLFFHYSEVRGDVDSLRLGTELEFGVLEGHRPGDKVAAPLPFVLRGATARIFDNGC